MAEIAQVTSKFDEARNVDEQANAVRRFRLVADEYRKRFRLDGKLAPRDVVAAFEGLVTRVKALFVTPRSVAATTVVTTATTATTTATTTTTTTTTAGAPSQTLESLLSGLATMFAYFLLRCAGITTLEEFHRAAIDKTQAVLLRELLGGVLDVTLNAVGGASLTT